MCHFQAVHTCLQQYCLILGNWGFKIWRGSHFGKKCFSHKILILTEERKEKSRCYKKVIVEKEPTCIVYLHNPALCSGWSSLADIEGLVIIISSFSKPLTAEVPWSESSHSSWLSTSPQPRSSPLTSVNFHKILESVENMWPSISLIKQITHARHLAGEVVGVMLISLTQWMSANHFVKMVLHPSSFEVLENQLMKLQKKCS